MNFARKNSIFSVFFCCLFGVVPVHSFYKSINTNVLLQSHFSFTSTDTNIVFEFQPGNYTNGGINASPFYFSLVGTSTQNLFINSSQARRVSLQNCSFVMEGWNSVVVDGIAFKADGGPNRLDYLSFSSVQNCNATNNSFDGNMGFNIQLRGCSNSFIYGNNFLPTLPDLKNRPYLVRAIDGAGREKDTVTIKNNRFIQRQSYGDVNVNGPSIFLVGPYGKMLFESNLFSNFNESFNSQIYFSGVFTDIKFVNCTFALDQNIPIASAISSLFFWQVTAQNLDFINSTFSNHPIGVSVGPYAPIKSVINSVTIQGCKFDGVNLATYFGGSSLPSIRISDSSFKNGRYWIACVYYENKEFTSFDEIFFERVNTTGGISYLDGVEYAMIDIVDSKFQGLDFNILGMTGQNKRVIVNAVRSEFRGARGSPGDSFGYNSVISMDGTGTELNIDSCLFENNDCGMYLIGTNVNISNCQFRNNNGSLDAAMTVVGSSSVSVRNSLFTLNNGADGSIMDLNDSPTEIYNCSVINNLGENAVIRGSNLKVDGCTFQNNRKKDTTKISSFEITDAPFGNLSVSNTLFLDEASHVYGNSDGTTHVSFKGCSFPQSSYFSFIRAQNAVLELEDSTLAAWGLREIGDFGQTNFDTLSIVRCQTIMDGGMFYAYSPKHLIMIENHVIGGTLSNLYVKFAVSVTSVGNTFTNDKEAFPNALQEMPGLRELNVSRMNYGGAFPTFPKIPTLTMLDISGNGFSGAINLAPVGNITYLDLSGNRPSSGTYPNLPLLESAILRNCSFSFPLSSIYFPNSPFINYLDLSDNRLSGVSVSWYGFKHVNLRNNRLTGPLARNMENVVYVDISNNFFNGTLPTPGGNLQTFLAKNNSFTGDIPVEFSQIPNLTDLDLSGNLLNINTAPSFESSSSSLSSCNLVQKINTSCPLPNTFGKCLVSCSIDGSIAFFEIRVQGNLEGFDFVSLTNSLAKILSISSARLQLTGSRSGSVIASYQVNPPNFFEKDSNSVVDQLLSTPSDAFKQENIQFLDAARGVGYNFPSSSTTQPNQVAPNNPSSNIGLIVGVVVGGVVLLLIIIVIVLLLLRKKREKRSLDSMELDIKNAPVDETNYTSLNVTQQQSPPVSGNQNLQMLEKLGEGGYGIVWKGLYNGQVVAIKQMRTEGISLAAVEDFLAEASVMKLLKPHNNVVGYVELTMKPLALITEFMKGGDLKNYLNKNPTLSIKDRLQILLQVSDGMAYLAKEKLVHKDLAARNVLLESETGPIVCKVSDFGMSRMLLAETDRHTSISNVGPIKWMAPESLVDRIFSEKTDVWSWGVLSIEVLTGTDPFPILSAMDFAVQAIPKQLHHKMIDEVPSMNISLDLMDLFKEVFSIDPNSRPTFSEISERLRKLI
eukprot:TRINITY_DN1814_c0_g1_i4.p1 TRINITY_DN1814_c0_g1~~TRINITY_DN1814_c0_g1_i4.p1  ORF type:complete len:1391 (+),score=458.45 TRINITY_DN1814_c0_g1_i4:84-4256(+)